MKEEPTFREHKVLENISKNGAERKTGKEDNIEMYWELVRDGFLLNTPLTQAGYDWSFKLTEKAVSYLEDIL